MLRSVILALTLSVLPTAALGQSLSPMVGDIPTVTDQAGLRLIVRNPYDKARRFFVEVLTEDGAPLPNVRLSAQNLPIGPGANSSLFVITPMAGENSRVFRVCVTSQTFAGGGNGIRGQVCGKYRAVRQQA